MDAKNLIGGVWSGPKGKFQTILDPATGKTIGKAPSSGAKEIHAAVAAAKEAQRGWAAVPAPRRGEILFQVARVMEARKQELGRIVTSEMGKVKAEALGDVQEAIDMAYYMAAEGRRLFGSTTPSELPHKLCFTLREPVGVCGLITPWNFPIAIPSWKSLPALICGNSVVLKPSGETGGCATAYVECLVEAGVPAGVVNLVHGTGEEAGAPLVAHPASPISMTGSTETGRVVNTVAAPMLKRVHVELGGKNGIIVRADADLDFAVRAILWSAYGTSGQRCTAGSRVIVEDAVHDGSGVSSGAQRPSGSAMDGRRASRWGRSCAPRPSRRSSGTCDRRRRTARLVAGGRRPRLQAPSPAVGSSSRRCLRAPTTA
jgi:aldehyde dehydrogenase (NAD+)